MKLTTTQAKQLQANIKKSPTSFYDNFLGCPYWSKQKEITDSVFHNQRTTVKSCHGSGKTYTAARMVTPYLFAHEEAIVITTAPTFKQVENQVWREIHNSHNKSKVNLGGRLLKTSYEIDSKWYAMGVSSDKSDNVIGYHGKSVLVICDEAAGIKPDILDAIEGSLTSANVSLLYIGNPTCAMGPFYDSHKSSMFNKISISVFDTPNFLHNKIRSVDDLHKFTSVQELSNLEIVNENLVTPLWAWGRLQAWGEGSPMFQAKVCAIFPEEGEDQLIRLQWVEDALEKEFTDEEWLNRPQKKCIGIDVARKGSNYTVFTAMDWMAVKDIDWHSGKDTMKTVGKGIHMFNELGFNKERDCFCIDDTGVGGGVSDRLLELGYHVLALNWGGKDFVTGISLTNKSELFWTARTAFMNGQVKIIDKGKLIAQLPTIRYYYRSDDKLQIVPKDQMEKDGFESPDWADSLALAIFGIQNMSAERMPEQEKIAGETGGLLTTKF